MFCIVSYYSWKESTSKKIAFSIEKVKMSKSAKINFIEYLRVVYPVRPVLGFLKFVSLQICLPLGSTM